MPYSDLTERRAASKRHYESHKAEYRGRNRDRRNKAARFVSELKETLCCVRCGEDHPKCLDFHHKVGADKVTNIAQMVRSACSVTSIKEEIEKCEVLCSNCHRKATWHFDGKQWRRTKY